MIAHHANEKPLWDISTHSSFSSRPSGGLHSTPNSSSPPLATAQFHPLSSTTHISILSNSGTANEKLESGGDGLGLCTGFSAFVTETGRREVFEWKRSKGAEVKSLKGWSHGMKLARRSTGQVVMAWATPSMSSKKRAKVAFLGERERFGGRWEVLAVVSCLAILEKARRKRNSAAAGGGAEGGGGGQGEVGAAE